MKKTILFLIMLFAAGSLFAEYINPRLEPKTSATISVIEDFYYSGQFIKVYEQGAATYYGREQVTSIKYSGFNVITITLTTNEKLEFNLNTKWDLRFDEYYNLYFKPSN